MTGTPCEHCRHGHLVCYCSKRIGDKMARFYHCYLCGSKPLDNKTISEAPPRIRTRSGTDTGFLLDTSHDNSHNAKAKGQ